MTTTTQGHGAWWPIGAGLRCKEGNKSSREEAADTTPPPSHGSSGALPAISSAAVTRDETDTRRPLPASARSEGQLEEEGRTGLGSHLAASPPGQGALPWKHATVSWQVPRKINADSASLFPSPVLCPLPLWHRTQGSWLAGSMGPYYEMSPDAVQTSPHC